MGCQTKGVSIFPLCSYNPIHLDTSICSESFHRVFILLVHKMFSYFRGSHGVVRLREYPDASMFIYPLYVLMPPYIWGHLNIWEHPNIQGEYCHSHMDTPLA